MQATSTAIRTARTAQVISEGMTTFAERAEQVAGIQALILTNGSPELHDDSSAVCTHFKVRKGVIEGHYCEAQLYTHMAGMVIRLWVYDDFAVKTRDLIILPSAEKGREIWLDTTSDPSGGRLFPHDGKYTMLVHKIIGHQRAGR